MTDEQVVAGQAALRVAKKFGLPKRMQGEGAAQEGGERRRPSRRGGL